MPRRIIPIYIDGLDGERHTCRVGRRHAHSIAGISEHAVDKTATAIGNGGRGRDILRDPVTDPI